MIAGSGLAFQKRISQTRINWNSFKLLNNECAIQGFVVEEEDALILGCWYTPRSGGGWAQQQCGVWDGGPMGRRGRQREYKD